MSATAVFDLRLRDYMGGALLKVGATAQNVFGKMDSALKNMQGHFSAAGSAGTNALGGIGTAANNATNNVNNLNNAMNRLNNTARSGGGGEGMFSRYAKGAFYGGLAARGVETAGRFALDSGREALGNGMDLERMKVGLQTFVGDKANAIVEGVLKQAIRTPFTTQQLLPIEGGLISTGMAPARANRDMMALANAIAGSGGSDFMLELMGSHLSQAASAGKIDGQLMREFQKTAHIPVNRIVGDYLYPNLSVQKRTKKATELDSITYDQFSNALYRASQAGGLYAGAMERLSQTMSGKNSTIKDAWWNMTAKLTESQMVPMKKWQDMIIHSIEDVPKIVERLTPTFSRLTQIVDELLPDMLAFGRSLGGVLKPAGSFLLSDEMTKLTKSVLSLSATMLDNAKPALDTFTSNLKMAASGLSGVGDILGGLLKKRAEILGWSKEHLPAWMNSFMTGGFSSIVPHAYDAVGRNFGKENAKAWMLGGPIWGSLYNGYQYLKGGNHPAMVGGSHGALTGLMNAMKLPSEINKVVPPGTKGADAAQTVSDAIVNGGKKQIIINFNKEIVGKQEFHVSSMREAMEVSMAEFEEKYLRVVQGVNASL